MTDLSSLRIFVCTAPIRMNLSFDGLMGLLLVIVYFRVKKTVSLTKNNIIRAENAGLKKAA